MMQKQDSKQRVALLLGSTGLVGGLCLRLLLERHRYAKVIAPTRRKLQLAHSHLENIVTDFSNPEALVSGLVVDDIFCCLGTTIKKAGSREAFEHVDYQLPYDIARLAKMNGASRIYMVSALGANANSLVFYNRVKGRLEKDICALNFDRTVILQPSLLDGDRDEFRAAESLSLLAFRCVAPILGNSFAGIRPVKAESVARCLTIEAERDDSQDVSVLKLSSEAISKY